MTTQIRSVGDLIKVSRAAANTAVTAGGGGDDTEVTGVTLDRMSMGTPQSAVLAIPFTATLAQDETLSLAYVIEEGEASNMSDAATLQSAAAAVIATGPSSGGTVTGTFEVNVPLMGAGQYVRAKFTPTMSAANTDTAALSAVIVFGGAERLPV